MKKKGNYNAKNATKNLITCVALNSTKKIISFNSHTSQNVSTNNSPSVVIASVLCVNWAKVFPLKKFDNLSVVRQTLP